MSLGCALVILGSKGQGHNALITENGLCQISFPLHLFSGNFIQRLPMSRGCALLISRWKGQRSRSQCIDNWKWFMSWRMCPIDLVSKGRGHNALITENGLYRIIYFPSHLSSWNFICRLSVSRGCALLILGSKGQSSMSQCIDNELITENGLCGIIVFSLHLSTWNFI